jgi:hypothetical protein
VTAPAYSVTHQAAKRAHAALAHLAAAGLVVREVREGPPLRLNQYHLRSCEWLK